MYVHTYIHTYIHTYTHTHIHTYIHIGSPSASEKRTPSAARVRESMHAGTYMCCEKDKGIYI
jgi:hypothetical protein